MAATASYLLLVHRPELKMHNLWRELIESRHQKCILAVMLVMTIDTSWGYLVLLAAWVWYMLPLFASFLGRIQVKKYN